jgi:SMI1/KNR4 family protein SUKH-1
LADIFERVRKRIESGSKDPGDFAVRPPAPVATYASIAADEQTLCFKVPALLKRLYVEVGNGGWGPGYGLLGLTGGAKDDLGQTADQCYVSLRERSTSDDASWRWPAGLLPLCHWGCAIYSCIDCTQPAFPMVAFDAVADTQTTLPCHTTRNGLRNCSLQCARACLSAAP